MLIVSSKSSLTRKCYHCSASAVINISLLLKIPVVIWLLWWCYCNTSPAFLRLETSKNFSNITARGTHIDIYTTIFTGWLKGKWKNLEQIRQHTIQSLFVNFEKLFVFIKSKLMIYKNNRILLSVLSMCWVFQFICGIIKEATWFFQNLFQLYRLYFLNIIKVADCLCWLTSGLEWPSISFEPIWDKYKCYSLK